MMSQTAPDKEMMSSFHLRCRQNFHMGVICAYVIRLSLRYT